MNINDPARSRDPLLGALQAGDLQMVQNIINGASLSFSKEWQDGYSLLCCALRCQHYHIAFWLLMKNCKINSICENSESGGPLHLAVETGHSEIVKLLLMKGAWVNSRNGLGETPLHVCCKKSNFALANMLLSGGCEADIPDCAHSTPLHVAVENECKELVQLLIQHEVNINSYTARSDLAGFTPLHLAVYKENEGIVEILLQNGAYVNALINTSHIDELSSIKSNNNIVFLNYSPLHLAAVASNDRVLKLLLDHGAKIDATIEQNGFSALHLAVERRRMKNILILFEHNADFRAKTKEGLDVLHMAVINSWSQLVEKLLVKGANVDTLSREMETPLFLAVEMGDEDLVELLLEFRADTQITNSCNQSPLHVAAEFSLSIVELLINKIDNIGKSGGLDQTHLCVAVKHGNPDIVSKLLEHKPSCGVVANQEALLFALKAPSKNYIDIINLLLKNGSSINPNQIDENLLYNHISLGNFEIFEHLLHQFEKRDDISALLPQRTIAFSNIGMTASLVKCNWKSKNMIDIGLRLVEYAIELKKWNFVNSLLSHGVGLQNMSQILLSAAKDDNVVLLKILVKNGANVNIIDKFGTTVLHFVVWNKNHNLVKFLLDKGAQVNAIIDNSSCGHALDHKNYEMSDSYSKQLSKQLFTSPLHIAVYRNNVEICKTLLEHHADVSSRDGFGRNCLHTASAVRSNDQRIIIETLLKYGTDVINHVDDFNRVPLYYTCNQTCVCSIAFQNEYCLYSECECDLYDDHDIHDVIELFVKHIALLIGDEKHVHPYNLQMITRDERSNELLSSCLQEIMLLKDEKISYLGNFFDILVRGMNFLTNCARNREIIKEFELNDHRRKFPLYCNMLSCRFNAAQERLFELKCALSSFRKLLSCNFPDIATNIIFDFLHLNDLKNISLAYNEMESTQVEKIHQLMER
ncbi:hypothetical protein QAD02_020380 [Eretmocerus hayati]|uniref:Uncharacterized protein n=1 Tax=Eretmocerus hayati TaxID=131215 RepID=A0ACC2PNA2_9HYME|nr:hypothetical protein QAD02_020380 [Eretmocerus hayati]